MSAERRVASDGRGYMLGEFVNFYGLAEGERLWDESDAAHPAAATTEASDNFHRDLMLWLGDASVNRYYVFSHENGQWGCCYQGDALADAIMNAKHRKREELCSCRIVSRAYLLSIVAGAEV